MKRNLAIDLDEATIVILDTDDECVNPINGNKKFLKLKQLI